MQPVGKGGTTETIGTYTGNQFCCSDFRILAAESGWDDTALQGFFLRGLAERVKDELAARDGTESLKELISLPHTWTTS